MRKIITLTLQDSTDLNKLLSRHKELQKVDVRFSGEKFTCKYMFNGINALIDCEPTSKGFEIFFREENSALLVRKALPSFNSLMTVRNGEFRILRPPKEIEAQMWLQKKNSANRTTAEELMYILIHSTIALEAFEPILIKREHGNTIEYKFPPRFLEIAEEFTKEMKLKKLKDNLLVGWDIVSLTGKQFAKVAEINKKNGREYNIDNIPLPKFCLSIYQNGITGYWFFEKVGNTVTCNVTDVETYITKPFSFDFVGRLDDGRIHAVLIENKDNEMAKWCEERSTEEEGNPTNWEWCANSFLEINTFMLNYGDVAVEVEEKQAVAQSEPKERKHNNNRRNTVRLFKEYKLVKNWTTKARKKAEITCLAWGVRGHIRHYRNGKTVFIESYVKGKDRAQYKGKEYALMPYRDA